MSWFNRSGRHSGWLALQFQGDHVDLVHASPGPDGRPTVSFCDSYRNEGSPTSTLSRLRKEFRLDHYRRTTLLPSTQYQLREIDAPVVPEAEVEAAVRWRMEELIDYPVTSATVQLLRIPANPAAGSGPGALCAVTARSEDVAACAAPFEAARVPLDAIDIPELAQRNIAALFEPPGLGVVMLAFYPDGGLLTFTRGGEFYASRRIEVPLARLMDGEPAKRMESFARIALEVQRSLDHFERQFRYVPISKLLVAPLPRDIGLHAYLASNIEGVVEALDLAAAMDLSSVPGLEEPELQSQYLPLIGAALRAEQDASA